MLFISASESKGLLFLNNGTDVSELIYNSDYTTGLSNLMALFSFEPSFTWRDPCNANNKSTGQEIVEAPIIEPKRGLKDGGKKIWDKTRMTFMLIFLIREISSCRLAETE